MIDLSPGVHKFIKHLDHIQAMKRGDMVAPIHVSIWPTIRCNFKCSYCCCKDTPRNQPDLSLDTYKTAIDVLSDYGTKAIEFAGGGEPLLWEGFNEAVSYAWIKGLKISLITNGTYLEKIPNHTLGMLSWLRISYQSVEHARSINYDHLSNVRYSGSFMVSPETEGLHEMISFCKERNIPLRVAVAKPCTEKFEDFIRYSINSDSTVFFSEKQHGTPKGCYMAWIRAAIDWRGYFLPCPSMHLSKEFEGSIPDGFILCHVRELRQWLHDNRVRDLGFRCSVCNCGKENNDFFHSVISEVKDEDFV